MPTLIVRTVSVREVARPPVTVSVDIQVNGDTKSTTGPLFFASIGEVQVDIPDVEITDSDDVQFLIGGTRIFEPEPLPTQRSSVRVRGEEIEVEVLFEYLTESSNRNKRPAPKSGSKAGPKSENKKLRESIEGEGNFGGEGVLVTGCVGQQVSNAAKVVQVTASLPPSRSSRSHLYAWEPETLSSRERRSGPIAFEEKDFDKGKALVLVAASNGEPVTFTARTVPEGVEVRFELVRDGKDHSKVKTGYDPTFEPEGRLHPNGVGSFYVKATCAGDDGYVVFPVVIVYCALVAVGTVKPIARRDHFRCFLGEPYEEWNFEQGKGVLKHRQTIKSSLFQHDSSPLMVHIKTGDFDLEKPELAGLELRAEVMLLGGGPSAKRGTDRVGVRFMNNPSKADGIGVWSDRSKTVSIVTRQPLTKGKNCFVGGEVDRGLIAEPPWLDAAYARGAEGDVVSRADEGGPCLGGPVKVVPQEFRVGKRFTVLEVDSPSLKMPAMRRTQLGTGPTDGAELVELSLDMEFKTYVYAWTDHGGVDLAGEPPEIRGVGHRRFTLIGSFAWRLRGAWTIATNTHERQLVQKVEPVFEITEELAPLDRLGMSVDAAGAEIGPPALPSCWRRHQIT